MTRINVVPPSELCDQHLLAEFRELTRIPNAVLKGRYSMKGQQQEYTLGTGHVKFFYDKLGFLFRRYFALWNECEDRGFNVNWIFPNPCDLPSWSYGEYEPTEEALEINRARIKERMPKNARFTEHKK